MNKTETIEKDKIPIIAAGITDPGKIRNNNEDNLYFDAKEKLFIVADGIGGQQAGERASEIVVTQLPLIISNELKKILNKKTNEDIISILDKGIRLASKLVRDNSNNNANLSGMGTTVVTCYIKDSLAFFSYMGDSRAYLLRDKKLHRLTEDHSMVGLMIKLGEITPEQAREYPLRHVITRHVGMEGDFGPDSLILKLKEGDKILLCTDGLTEMLEDHNISQIMVNESNTEKSCRKLINASNKAGGKDNITVLVIQYGNSKNNIENKNEKIEIKITKSYLQEYGII